MPNDLQVITSIRALQTWSADRRKRGKTIALVPTMGFLHEGHLSLIDVARSQGADAVIVSIFVNPTQFGPTEDLDKYPRDFERDKALCESKGVAVIFAPSVSEMYPAPTTCWVNEEELSRGLCGAARPIHFRGVATVVAKLFLAALPDLAVFGQKDAQQAAIIRRMVRDLNFPVEIYVAPIVREPDGLARSSRNKYLSPDEHRRALSISKALLDTAHRLETGASRDPRCELTRIRAALEKAGGRVDYVEMRDADTMQEIPDSVPPPRHLLFLVACYFGTTRLIDNGAVRLPE